MEVTQFTEGELEKAMRPNGLSTSLIKYDCEYPAPVDNFRHRSTFFCPRQDAAQKLV